MDDKIEAELVQLTDRLHAEGWAPHVTVERLLENWNRLANEVHNYTLTIDDYTNDLTARDGLELVLNWSSRDAHSRIAPTVSRADEKFTELTADDGGVAIGRYFGVTVQSGWWWRRRPTTGELSHYLDQPRA